MQCDGATLVPAALIRDIAISVQGPRVRLRTQARPSVFDVTVWTGELQVRFASVAFLS